MDSKGNVTLAKLIAIFSKMDRHVTSFALIGVMVIAFFSNDLTGTISRVYRLLSSRCKARLRTKLDPSDRFHFPFGEANRLLYQGWELL